MGEGIWLEAKGQHASEKQIAMAELLELFRKD
jgi:hypothetical protein